MNVTILAANGQIAHLVEERLLTEPTFKGILHHRVNGSRINRSQHRYLLL